ncbi:MAG TPA: type I DNA topoisomerase [Acidimicrobiales bacterium]|nr:type I DNA topoisomerase [Acidimicrobiales bacterium]
MAKALVIVESPAKAKTIARFLGDDFIVEPSVGHIRDLPGSAKEIPAAYKGESWARLGVDVDNDFKALYVVSASRIQQVKKLQGLVKNASIVYLATDEDREGESIAWHLLEVLSPRVEVKRMVFHEITKSAIDKAIANPRELDRRLVDAQETRRILDRLYGYELSPVLWKKVMPGLSAGRVQSVATRVVVERERERMAFRSATWWSLAANVATKEGESFSAALSRVANREVVSGKDFNALGDLIHPDRVVLLDEQGAGSLARALTEAPLRVESVEDRPYRRSPAAPFITSTLQQEASRKLHFSAQRAMQTAQRLYEQGYITYMRTDSTTLSDTALRAAREIAVSLYGVHNVPTAPRSYIRKVKNAQEAHEAIRPAGDTFRLPADVSREVATDEARLYELIFQRTVASQMIDAAGVTASVKIGTKTTIPSSVASAGTPVEFSASGTVITSPGFLLVYTEDRDEEDEVDESPREGGLRLPALSSGEVLSLVSFAGADHATKPPARFTEASLVKRLEDLGVGRPSTYASIMQTIQDRGYVWKKQSALIPTYVAFAVVGLLENNFATLIDYGFTASMEDDLDEIAAGSQESVPWLQQFYFGDAKPLTKKVMPGSSTPATMTKGLKSIVLDNLESIDARGVNTLPLGLDPEGRLITVRVGRFGPYLERGEYRAQIPEDLAPDELTIERALELLNAPSGDRELGIEPDSGETVVAKNGRFGPYVQVGEPIGKKKPRTASLFKSMSVETLSLDDALKLLQLPRSIGTDPSSGGEIIARNGRYGPYIQLGTDSRTLDSEEQLLSISIDEALAIFAQPKQRRFGRAAATPAKEVGIDPDVKLPITLRQGRFGPYVTDGTYNASLRRGDDPERLTLDRAAELLAEKRAAGPPPAKRGRVRAGGKRSVAKKSPAKKASAKKSPTKRSVAKKNPAKKASAKRPAAQKVAGKKAVPTRTTSSAELSRSASEE